MKAISLWQPYASFMRDDLKWNETRGFRTHYRGELAICAAKRNWTPGEFGDEVEWLARRMEEMWHAENKPNYLDPRHHQPPCFPKGFVVCVVNLVACKPVEESDPTPLERVVGDYSAGRFAWITRGNRRLKTPVPVIGRQDFSTCRRMLNRK